MAYDYWEQYLTVEDFLRMTILYASLAAVAVALAFLVTELLSLGWGFAAALQGAAAGAVGVLTQLLGDSLGGDSDAVMVCTIDLSKAQQTTTRRSLQFASRCMVVENAPTKQVVVDGQSTLPTWRAEMKALRAELEAKK